MHLLDVLQGKAPLFKRRSPKWRAVRDRHLKRNPFCVICGGTKKLRVHHKVPFYIDPGLELEPTNLITLCEFNRSFNCHLIGGHKLSYKRWNTSVDLDAAFLRATIFGRKNE